MIDADEKRLLLHFGAVETAWSAPNPRSERVKQALNRVRDLMLSTPDRLDLAIVLSLADAYLHLTDRCPTTGMAVKKLREIRRTLQKSEKPCDRAGPSTRL